MPSLFGVEADAQTQRVAKLQCPQCLKLLQQPKRISPCSHVMCHACVTETCGVCKEAVLAVAPDSAKASLVNAFMAAN